MYKPTVFISTVPLVVTGAAAPFTVAVAPGSVKVCSFTTEELKKHFEVHPPQNSNEAKEKIKEITGIERCPTQVRIFMKEMGMKIRKVGFIPGKASTPEKQQEQEDFKKNSRAFSGKG